METLAWPCLVIVQDCAPVSQDMLTLSVSMAPGALKDRNRAEDSPALTEFGMMA